MRPARILVVEDHPLMAQALVQRLVGMGYEVPRPEQEGLAALEAVRREGADLVLMDIRLAGEMDGIEAGRLVRERFRIPVIYLTSHGDDETLRRATEAGPDGLLLKPVDPRELRAAIELSLRRRSDAEEGAIEGRYYRIFRKGPVPFLLATVPEGTILEVNDAFLQQWGGDMTEVVGRRIDELEWWVVPRDRERLLAAVRARGVIRELEAKLRSRSGKTRAVLLSGELLELEDTDALVILIHDISERKRVERKLERLALYDAITGLPNRTLFTDRLEHALDRAGRRGGGVAVLFLDLDGFKDVNDTLGHAAGDEVLASVARRIRLRLRRSDTFARLGGDEFGVILEGLSRPEATEVVIRRIFPAFDPPFRVGETEVRLSASVGITIGGGGLDAPTELIRAADRAMYRAKETPGPSFRFEGAPHGEDGADGTEAGRDGGAAGGGDEPANGGR